MLVGDQVQLQHPLPRRLTRPEIICGGGAHAADAAADRAQWKIAL